MSERIAYFDCFSGASGDMILGALVDAGLPVEQLSADLAAIACEPLKLNAARVKRGGLAGTKVDVLLPDEEGHGHDHEHRGLSDIRDIVRKSRLSDRVKADAIRIFERLGEAEAAAHGTGIEEVHFHEVGALDAIADIVGAAAGLERLGIGRVLFSTLRVGGGTVRTLHGILPAPAPATAALTRGLVTEMGPVQFELLTPTAAAILTTLGQQSSPGPLRALATGYGAGQRDFPGHPNLLRVTIGEAAQAQETDSVWVLEANLDDITPEMCGYAIARLLETGALDAWVAPIQMKKSRPGFMLCAIATDALLPAVEEAFFRETTTFGVRRHRVERAKLERECVPAQTPYGSINVKAGRRGGKVVTASPEYEDCRAAAQKHGVALRVVMEAAQEAFRRMQQGTP